MKILPEGLSGVNGFSYLGKNIGIKKEKSDFAVLFSENICNAAGVFTQNQIKGAPVYVTMEHLENHQAQAIVVNSGIANVATCEEGLRNAQNTAKLMAAELAIRENDVLVASTGVIGPQLPFEKIRRGIKGSRGELTKTGKFAEAIMTTDTFKKEFCVEHQNFRIAAATKGAGMVSPNMATMLAFIVTDADIAGKDLTSMLKKSVSRSFNMMTVDMDTSTSDMALILANGAAKDVDKTGFQQALDFVCVELAKLIARDGEGATKLIITEALNVKSQTDANKIAKAIVSSNLVKCAVYGNDPNWGRLIMAIGNSGAETIIEERLKIWINGHSIVLGGKADASYDEKNLSEVLRRSQEVTITVDVGTGGFSARAYGCDMSQEYVKINAEYAT